MAGVLGPDSGYPKSPAPIWPLANEDLAVFTVGMLFLDTSKIFQNSIFYGTLPVAGCTWRSSTCIMHIGVYVSPLSGAGCLLSRGGPAESSDTPASLLAGATAQRSARGS